MRYYNLILVALVAVLAAACGGKKTFLVTGEIDGGANTNLYIRYYGNGALQTLVTAAREGKFVVKGSADEPVVAEILDNDRNVLGIVYVVNGDELTISIDMNNRFRNKIDGNDINKRWCEWLNANADVLNGTDAKAANALVAKYINEHPDDVVSTLLLATCFDTTIDQAETADLLATLSDKAIVPSVIAQLSMASQRYDSAIALGKVNDFKYRTAKTDTAQTFSASNKKASLIAFTNDQSQRPDSVVPVLKKIYKEHPAADFQIMDIVLLNDTSAWKRNIDRDSAQWIQGWVPGGILSDDLNKLAVPALPYYIVADKQHKQCYRGTSLEAANRAVKEILSK